MRGESELLAALDTMRKALSYGCNCTADSDRLSCDEGKRMCEMTVDIIAWTLGLESKFAGVLKDLRRIWRL